MESPAALRQLQSTANDPTRPRLAIWRQPEDSEAESSSVCGWRRDLLLVVGLMLAVATLRCLLIANTSVAARDSIGFIRYAMALEEQPLSAVCKREPQHPGYSALILFASWPVRYFWGGTDPASMQLSAQLVSGLASILIIIPMYFLGKEFFDRPTAFWGAAIFQFLPVSSRILSDGLSEASFFLFTAIAVLAAVWGARKSSGLWFAISGAMGGCAYLVRPDGLAVVLAPAIVLLGVQFVRPWRRSFTKLVVALASLLLAAVAVGGPYAYMIGGITNKPTPRLMLESLQVSEMSPLPEHSTSAIVGLAERRQGIAKHILAIYAPEHVKDRKWWGLLAITKELTQAYQYIVGIPVLLGLWWFRSKLRENQGAWVSLTLAGLHFLVLWRLAIVVGYVSDRHVLMLVFCSVFTCAAAIIKIGNWLGDRLRASRANEPSNSWCACCLLLGVAAFGLADLGKPLHLNRIAHRMAGSWIAANSLPADPVFDPYSWAHYYAGRVFWEGKTPPMPSGHQRTQYIVLEQSANEHSRLPTIAAAQAYAAKGRKVYHWPESKPESEAKILVYALACP